jgi:glycine hydroxymethyltransferase
MAHNGDPMVDANGQIIGEVTCCSIDTEGYRLGQAHIDFKSGKEGTPVAIYQGAGEVFAKTYPDTGAELDQAIKAAGGKVRSPEAATVLSRFPKKK